MDLSEIRKLVRLMQRAELTELEIDDSNSGLRVHLKRSHGGGEEGDGGPRTLQPVVQVVPGAGAPAAGMPVPVAAAEPVETGPPPGTVTFDSPMVGTFYRAPAPDADPFVERGTRVDDEAVLCIIEAMKVMNEIKAEIRGEIVDVLVENGEPVEFGQPLFLIKKS